MNDIHFADGQGIRPIRPTAITLFSGLGSSSKAARDLGHEVLAHDFNKNACASLLANGFDCVQGDIRDVDFLHPRYARVKLVIGGPPCQPFSQGGRNLGKEDPRDMLGDFYRAVHDTQPDLFILENVKGLMSPRHLPYFLERVQQYRDLGYEVEYRLLDAADYSTGQARKRLFLIGRKGADVSWPEKSLRLTMAQVLGWSLVNCFERNQIAPPKARCASLEDSEYLWPLQQPSTTVVGSFMPQVQAAPGYRSTGDGPRQNAKGSVVTTLEERLVLQGLPRDWKVEGSKTARDLQVGNSCPSTLLKALVAANS